MTGMKCMLRIARKDAAFDYDRFFRAYAHGWLIRQTPETAKAVTDDPHPMNYQRINVTSMVCICHHRTGLLSGDTIPQPKPPFGVLFCLKMRNFIV